MLELTVNTALQEFRELTGYKLVEPQGSWDGLKLAATSPAFRVHHHAMRLVASLRKHESNPDKREDVLNKIRNLEFKASAIDPSLPTALFSQPEIVDPLAKLFSGLSEQEKYDVWHCLKHSASMGCFVVAKEIFKNAFQFDRQSETAWLSPDAHAGISAPLRERMHLGLGTPHRNEAARTLAKIYLVTRNEEALAPLFESVQSVLTDNNPNELQIMFGAIACSWLTHTHSINSPKMECVHEYLERGYIVGNFKTRALEGWGDYSTRLTALNLARQSGWLTAAR